MIRFTRMTVSAHCDLPCGVYDPAQARIEAESIKAICKKVAENDDPDFRTRAAIIKESRSHFEKCPNLNALFNEATKLAGASGTKGSFDEAQADALLAKIAEIDAIFWETKKA